MGERVDVEAMEAYLREDDRKIRLRTNVYTPDHVVVLDPTLVEVVDVVRELVDRPEIQARFDVIGSSTERGTDGMAAWCST